MRKASKRITSSFLAASMMIPAFGLPVTATETATPEAAEQEYKIYPTPQSIVYAAGTTEISSDINIVYSSGIDQFTKDHAAEVFALLGDDVTLSTSDAAVEGKTNVFVGVKGEDSPAQTYFDEHTINASDLFDEVDSYALEINNGTISILGVTTDAAFYGLSSLHHIFKQVENKTVRNLRMEDYADVKTRGFIEGYYGNPWSFEDREDLMRFGGDYKLNGYFYAPKDDPKHNKNWRELYTDEELEKHRGLAQAGNESKCYYIYALHPFMYNAINFGDNYESDLQIIKNKFEQMMGVGVKQFAILADDAGVPSVGGASSYVRLMTDLTNWLKEKQATVPGLKSDMIFCPNDYMGNGSSAQMQALKAMPDSVSLIQTGGMVWGTVGPTFNNTFYSNMNRPAFMWINWPCSDNTKDSLIMGAALRFLAPGTNKDTVDGIVLNPMQQSEPSKEALFTNADYAWNLWETAEKYDEVWYDSFNYIDHGTKEDTPASAGLRELSKHMQCSATAGTDESLELQDKLTAFTGKIQNHQTLTSEEIAEMRNEFQILADASKAYRAGAGNQRTLGQIIYWIDAWDDTTGAVLGYIDTLEKLQNGAPLTEIWDSFSKAQALRDQSETHTYHYVDHNEHAVAGRKHVTPFMNRLDALLSDQVLPLVDPNREALSFITNRTDTPTGALSNATDNNATTEIIFKDPNSLSVGDYVGVMSSKPIDINEVKILLGRSGNLGDTFSTAKLQYTEDGETWIDLGEEVSSPQDLSQTNMGLKNVRGIRVVATAAKSNTWLGVRDFVINPKSTSSSDVIGTFSLPANNAAYSTYAASRAYDGDTTTFLWTNQEAKANDTFTWTYPEDVNVRNVHIAMGADGADKWNSFVLESSQDGTDWTTHQTFSSPSNGMEEFDHDLQNITVRYVRIRNLTAKSNWVKLTEFTVETSVGDPYTQDNLMTNTEIEAGVYFNANESKLKAEGEITLAPGEYLGMDLERIVDITSIDPGTDAEGISVQSSRNDYEWAAFDAANPGARYVRLINNTDAPITLTMKGDFIVTTMADAVIHLEESDIGRHATYGNQDTRENGAAFDGNVNTATLFADFPQAGQSIVYDLAQLRSISKLTIYAQDSATNYISDADILISADKENWTKVFSIGDGVENNDDLGITCLNSDAGYTASSTYPNKVQISGTIEPTMARYIKISFPVSNDIRFAGFNEIEINDGEYVPVYNAAFRTDSVQKENFIPANLTDGSLATSWAPATDAAGYIEYDFSEKLENNHFNIISKGEPSHATVKALAVKDGKKEWVTLGTLDGSLSQFAVDAEKVLTLQIAWDEGKAPTISEIISFYDEIDTSIDTTLLEAAIAKYDDLDRGAFNEDSRSILSAEISKARSALMNRASQDAVNTAAADLNRALLAARRTPSKDALAALK